MESRFILGQQALTPDGAVYQIIWDTPYNENITPDLVARALSGDAPEDTVAGSTCIFNTEDADGYPVEWLFAFDGEDWALDRVIRGGSAGGGGASTANVTFIAVGGDYTVVRCPYVDNGLIYVYAAVSVQASNPITLQIPLGSQGTVIDQFNNIDANTIVTEGDISLDGGHCIVTGDGTITIKGTASPK